MSQEGAECGEDVPSTVPGNRGEDSEFKCSVKET